MTCEESQNLINAKLDNELTPQDRARLDTHLASCPTCVAMMETLAAQHDELRLAFSPHRRAAAQVAQAAIAQLPQKSSRRIPWLVMLTSAAAGFALAFALFHQTAPKTFIIQPTSLPATRPASIAQLALSTGAVQFKCPGQTDWSTMATGGSIPAGTQIRTGPDVRCEFHTVDGADLRLNTNTLVRLDSTSGYELLSGEVWSNTGHALNYKATAGDISCLAGGWHGRTGQFNLKAQSKLVTLIVSEGPVHLAVAGGDQTNLSSGETATVTDGHLGGKTQVHDLALATGWVNEILVMKGRDNPELSKRIDDLFAQIGQQKMGFMFEEEIRGLGDHCVIPLTKYIESDRSKNDPAQRATAARIISDVAPPWAIPHLITLLQNTDGEVRYYAALGLRRLTGHNNGRSPEQWRTDDLFTCQQAATQWQTWWTENHTHYPGAPSLDVENPPIARQPILMKKS